MADDKKPIPRARLVQLLTPSKKPKISVKKPSLSSISVTGGEPKEKAPKTYTEPIPISKVSSTAVPDIAMKANTMELRSTVLDNTIKYLARNKGMGEVSPTDAGYNMLKQDVENQIAGGYAMTKDEYGNKIFGLNSKSDFEDLVYGIKGFNERSSVGWNYLKNDASKNMSRLEEFYRAKPQGLPVVRGSLPTIVGSMLKPVSQGIGGAIAGAAVGGTPGFITGAVSTFLLSTPDAVGVRYGDELESRYIQLRNQGVSQEEAYKKANAIAKYAIGGEVGLQAAFSVMGGGAVPKKALMDPAKKSLFAKTFGQYGDNVVSKGALESAKMGGVATLSALPSELKAKQLGVEESPVSKALSIGGDFAVFDAVVRSISGITKVPKIVVAQAKNAGLTADKKVLNAVIKAGEESGAYPKGTARKVLAELASFQKAKDVSPDFGSDAQRESTVVGLTEAYNNLVEKQKKASDVHKADFQPQIDELVKRIEAAKKAENPLDVEVYDDGTPINPDRYNTLVNKPKEDATKISTGEVKESVPEGGVSQREGAQEVKPIEAVKPEEAATTDIGNRPISGEAQQVKPAKGETLKPTEKARNVAESEMEGIKSDDYAELQRVAFEMYAKKEVDDVDVMANKLRSYQEQKGDTSSISDNVFIQIAKETKDPSFNPVVKEPAAKRVKFTFEEEVEPMRVTARDAFRGMYMAANNVGKEVKIRTNLAAKAVKDALKGKGLDLDENQLTRAIGKFVSSKMDSDNAMQSFMDNLDEIIGEATNVTEKATARKGIKTILQNAKNPAYSTVGIKDYTASIDWISPSKIDPEQIGEYNRLLTEYNKSITGQITESETARKDLKDFTDRQREWANNKRKKSFEDKYDKLVKKGEINPAIVSKEEYVFWNTEPSAVVKPDAQAALKLLDDSEAEVMKEMTAVRQEMLSEYINSEDMNPAYKKSAEEVRGFDVKKVSSKNIKLLNNIIEDIMSGERPSRVGEIATDIGAFDALERMKNERVRTVAGIKTAGIGKVRKKLFGWEGTKDNYKKFGLTNILRQIGFNEDARTVFRSSILGEFPKKMYSLVVNKSKQAAQEISNLYTGSKVKGKKLNSSRINEIGDTRIGIVAALRQYEDLYKNLETVKNSLITLSKISKDNSGEYTNYVKTTIEALKSLDLVESVTETGGILQDIRFKEGKNSNDLILQLNDRELSAYEYAKSRFADIAPTLDETVRDVYGASLDLTNNNYIPMSPFFTGDNRVVDLETSAFGDIPSFVRSMRAGTTFERQPFMVGSTNVAGKDLAVHYDFRFMKNFLSKYHESLTTAHTARDVKQISKVINSSKFNDIMSGAFNVEPSIFNENAGVVKDSVETFVNGIRSPHNLSSAQIKERNLLSKFFYSKLLYSYNQIFKQSLPSWGYLMTEGGGLPFINSHKIVGKSLVDKETMDALKVFLSNTSQTDRIAGGLEVFSKDIANLDASDARRMMGGISNFTTKFTGLSFDLGDKYTTINSLMVGYMNGLKRSGKLENFSNFDIVQEAKNGFDKDALAYAENFASQVNSEPAPYSKAAVLRDSDSVITRMLQSFSLNQWANFQIDVGVVSDRRSTPFDRAEALKRIGQYFLANAIYSSMIGFFTSQTGNAYKYISSKYKDIEKANESEESVEIDKKREDLAYIRSYMGTAVDLTLGGTGLLASQAIKGGAILTLEGIKSYYRDKKERMGERIEGTWVSPEFNFIYRNNSIGVSGAYFEDIEKAWNGTFGKNSENPDERIQSQREHQKTIDMWILGGALIAPTPDVLNFSMTANKELRKVSINRNEYLAGIYLEKTFAQDDYSRQYWEGRYAYETKDIRNLNIVEAKTILPLADKLYRQDRIASAAKKFDRPGDKVSSTLLNISRKSGEQLFKIMNNRYAGQDIRNNSELMMLVQLGGISPEEYAASIAMDKDGKPIIGFFDDKQNWEVMKSRFIEADRIAPTTRLYKAPGSVGSVNELVELFAKYANKSALYEDITK